MRPVTVGTAGHIDHGKSALVRALTGIDPDRLAEEQRRGMTLDLGFAHLDLPSGRRLGLVDVPGHEALIHNMLAGAGGIDLVMLVVAADEGTMPQTREHLDVLRFLRLTGGVIVVTKVDLVGDDDWLAAVEDELRELVQGSPLAAAAVVRVSAKTGEGLPVLVAELDRLAASVPARPIDGPARLPVDRSFTMQGFGTVATGTLWSGTIRTGDLLAVLPAGREARVRGIQVHGATVAEAVAGSRVAINVAGLEKDEIQRGDVLATPGAFRPTGLLDVRLRLLPGAPALKQSARLHLHLGSGAVVGRAVLSDRAQLVPGDEAVVRLRLEAPVVAIHGDRFVVRRYSPTETLGGGVVTNPAPGRGRAKQTVAHATGEPGPAGLLIAAAAVASQAGLARSAAAAAAGVDPAVVADAIAAALTAGNLVERGDRLFAGTVVAQERLRIEGVLSTYHVQTSWRQGMPREDLKSRASSGPADRLFDSVLTDLIAAGRIVERAGLLALREFEPQLSDADQRTRRAVLLAIEQAGASAPGVEELRHLGAPDSVDRALQALIDEGLVVAVPPDLRFSAGTLDRIRAMVVEMLQAGAEVTVAVLRDRLQTSRKYALALLEHFDTARVTRRVGDRRVLGTQAGSSLSRPR
jgi:selenocysteine-specific elongation factor